MPESSKCYRRWVLPSLMRPNCSSFLSSSEPCFFIRRRRLPFLIGGILCFYFIGFLEGPLGFGFDDGIIIFITFISSSFSVKC